MFFLLPPHFPPLISQVKFKAKAEPPAMGIIAQLEESHIWDFSHQVHNCAKPQSNFNVSLSAAPFWLRQYFTDILSVSGKRCVFSSLHPQFSGSQQFSLGKGSCSGSKSRALFSTFQTWIHRCSLERLAYLGNVPDNSVAVSLKDTK